MEALIPKMKRLGRRDNHSPTPGAGVKIRGTMPPFPQTPSLFGVLLILGKILHNVH
jgi:hypothetical protein